MPERGSLASDLWVLVVVGLSALDVDRSALSALDGLSAEGRSADELSGNKYNLSYILCDKLYIGMCRREGERSFSVLSKETVN